MKKVFLIQFCLIRCRGWGNSFPKSILKRFFLGHRRIFETQDPPPLNILAHLSSTLQPCFLFQVVIDCLSLFTHTSFLSTLLSKWIVKSLCLRSGQKMVVGCRAEPKLWTGTLQEQTSKHAVHPSSSKIDISPFFSC